MRINKLVAALWMSSAAIFGLGVFLLAQSAIGPTDVIRARNAEIDAALKHSDTIRENTIRKSQAETATAASNLSAEMKSAGRQEEAQAVPLPVKKEDAPDRWVRVAGTEAVMRSDAKASAPMIVAFPVGRKLSVLAEDDDWTKVAEPNSGTTGWIAADQLDKPGEARIARLDRGDRGIREGRRADDTGDWALEMEDGPPETRADRRRTGPLGGLLRRALGRF